MNRFIGLLLIGTLFLILVSCSQSQKVIEVQNIITVEVTRIVEATTTPTLGQLEISQTRVVNEIGTPIISDLSCYESAITQLELNDCSIIRKEGLEKEFDILLKFIQQKSPQESYEQFLEFQNEWENFVVRECEFRSGYLVIETDGVFLYKGGSMAPLQFNECLVSKYEDRLRELQIYLFENSR